MSCHTIVHSHHCSWCYDECLAVTKHIGVCPSHRSIGCFDISVPDPISRSIQVQPICFSTHRSRYYLLFDIGPFPKYPLATLIDGLEVMKPLMFFLPISGLFFQLSFRDEGWLLLRQNSQFNSFKGIDKIDRRS